MISIGLVSDDGRQFYGERNDFDSALCSEFVKSTVLPLLGKKQAAVYSKSELSLALSEWLQQFKEHGPVLCFDFAGDVDSLRGLLNDVMPAWLETRNVQHQIDQQKFEWYIETFFDGRQHHALYDALANKFSYQEVS